MNKRKAIVITVSVLLMAVFSACGIEDKANSVAEENQLVYASDTEFAGLNPILEETNLDDLLFRGVMKFDEENTVVKDIAETVQISEDSLTYEITLREDIQFHDGEQLKADDVVFTIDSILDDSNASFLKADFKAVDSISKTGDYKVKIQLKNPFSPFLDKLTVPILPKHAFEGVEMRNAEFSGHPIGAGPYMFAAWERGNSLILKANDNFHGTVPSIEKVIFKFIPDSNVRALQLKSGEVDIALLDPVQAESMENAKEVVVQAMDTADYRGILYNMKNPLWQDVNVRKAFNYAVDRKEIVKGILKGFGTEAYSPLQKHAFNNEESKKYSYDLQKAEVLLDKAGWKKRQDGYRYKGSDKLAFTITAPVTDTIRVNIANYAAEGFKEIGADVKVEVLDWSAIAIEETDAFIIAWGSPYDADHHTYVLFHTDQSSTLSFGYNYGNYSNEKVDRLLEQGRELVTEEERKAVYRAFQKELAQDPPYNFIAYTDAVYGINKQLSGVKERKLGHHGSGFLWNVEEWEWDDR